MRERKKEREERGVGKIKVRKKKERKEENG